MVQKRALCFCFLSIICIFFSCQKGTETKTEKDKILAESICNCTDDLYQFNIEAQKTLPEAEKALRAEILRNAEAKMNELEQCIIKQMGKNQIAKGEIDIQLIEKRLIELCKNKPQTFSKRVLQDIQAIL